MGQAFERSSCHAYAASRTLRAIVFWSRSSPFFTNCCVIVEPPSTTFLCLMSAISARPMPRRSIPSCSQKRRSSIATIACRIGSEMSSYSIRVRASDPRSTARIFLPLES